MSRRATSIAVAIALVGLVAGIAWVATGMAGNGAPGTGGGGAGPAPHFVDEAASAGVDHRYDGEFEYFVGGGVAVLDCDTDGRPDLYIAGGERPAALYRNRSPVGGALAFEPIAEAATDLDAVTGAYPLDIDADGHTDLAVLRHGVGNVLLRGLGDCRFEPANERWNVDGGEAWTTAFSATWESDATLPTLAFGNYLVPDESRRTIECDTNVLVRPDGDVYGEPVTLAPGYCALSMLFSDWDRTGRHDLRVSNDRHYYRDGSEQLWRMEPGKEPRLYTADEGWQTVRIFGMGIASRDLTGDGRPEVYLTSQADNRLQTLEEPASGDPSYVDIALQRGATAHRPYAGEDTEMPSTAWHPEFADVNNDGFVDLFVSKGNVEATAEYAAQDPSNLLLGQTDGTFVEAAIDAGIMTFARARGAALADLNLDGLLDLVFVTRREPVQLWRNVGAGTAEAPKPMGHWIGVRLQQDGPNRDAVGAWIEVDIGEEVISIEHTVGGGHVSGQSGWIHVGIGSADAAEVTVTWPDGEGGPPMRIGSDGFAVIKRGAEEPEPWSPSEEDR
jgi:enediyne biosynthesis protein E4